jgi:geranylgeranyl diphosphate synthase type I
MAEDLKNEIDSLVEAVNNEISALLDTNLRQAPARENPGVRRVYDGIYEYLLNSGKRMHAISVILAFRAVGGQQIRQILPVAAGFQLYHYHTLIHDDIYDEDDLRRGLPTFHRAFADWYGSGGASGQGSTKCRLFLGKEGRAGAVAAFAQGKIVHALALRAIFSARFSAEALNAVVQEVNRHDLTDNAGQLLDVLHEGRLLPEKSECLEIARVKTGRLFAVGVECAARLAAGTESQVKALSGWIEKVATAYQLQDDLSDLDTFSEKGRGRCVGTDLRHIKPT